VTSGSATGATLPPRQDGVGVDRAGGKQCCGDDQHCRRPEPTTDRRDDSHQHRKGGTAQAGEDLEADHLGDHRPARHPEWLGE